MNLRQLEYLDAVARCGSFTAASQELKVVQPAVSQTIKLLENELGLTLIDRATKQPTAAGSVLLNRVRRIFSEMDAARSEIGELIGLERGIVRAGAIHWLEPFDLPGLLQDFATSYPGISVDLREHDATTMFDMLLDGRMDLVFSNIAPGAAVPAGLERRHVVSEPLVVGVATTHSLATRKSVRLEELADEPFVAFRHGSAFRETVDAALSSTSPEPAVRFESSDLATVRSLAAAGLGVALMPQSLATAPGPPIATLRITPRAPERTVALTWRADLSASPAARAFLELALDRIEDL